ncbi:MAG: hypothetical protein K0R61_5666 [Microvirga sp.]|nr:hypothetical protein [Microvirga sp.]
MIALEDKLEGRKRGFAAMHPDQQGRQKRAG